VPHLMAASISVGVRFPSRWANTGIAHNATADITQTAQRIGRVRTATGPARAVKASAAAGLDIFVSVTTCGLVSRVGIEFTTRRLGQECFHRQEIARRKRQRLKLLLRAQRSSMRLVLRFGHKAFGMRFTVALLFLLAAAPLAKAQDAYPPPGMLVDIGGRRLHLYCTGAGNPTVILAAGASSFAIDWALVQPSVSRTNRVCSYDRAGYGWSDAAPFDARGEEAVRDLRVALSTTGERAPFVLVGHSMGGRFMRLFQHLHPMDVVGMVLIDAEHEDGLFIGVNSKPVAISTLSDEEFEAASSAPTQPVNVAEPHLQPAHQHLPMALQPVRLWLESRLLDSMRNAKPDAIVATMKSEHTALATLHRIDTSETHPFNNLPLVVLTRGVNSGPRWQAWQADLVRLSTNSKQAVVADSDHEIQLFRPDVVVGSIAEVVDASRNGNKLQASGVR
jgi:pimeloyl-ACP methyl ester carboxylesterase